MESWSEAVHDNTIPDYKLMAQILKPSSLRKIPPWIVEDCRQEALRRQLTEAGRAEPSFRLTMGLVRWAVLGQQKINETGF